MKDSKWIKFEMEPVSSKRKTNIYQIWTKDGTCLIGDIRWYAPWRKYCFYPCSSTIFETQCLSDIVHFMNELMERRKIERIVEKTANIPY